jgi:hypothetical protein
MCVEWTLLVRLMIQPKGGANVVGRVLAPRHAAAGQDDRVSALR